jgi:phosphonate transport system substrate-binding protein
MRDRLVLAAVTYDPKVVTIWNGFCSYFEARGLAVDTIFYSNYDAQVDGHLAGHCDIAWNSPLAWISTNRRAARYGGRARAVAMRDTDRDLTSIIVAHKESGISSLKDLAGKRVAVGATDSPQATLIPLQTLFEAGVEPSEVVAFNVGLGLHGDHIGGERDAARALMSGAVDACCILEANRLLFSTEGVLPSKSTVIVGHSELFDHCNFTVLDDPPEWLIESFITVLLSMKIDDPVVGPLMRMEGLTRWMVGRTSGYGILTRAVDRIERSGK